MHARLRDAALLSALAVSLALAGTAHAWSEIHAAAASDAGECVAWSPARIDCFTRTASGSLSWTYFENAKWSAPHDLGGKLAAAPSCVVRGPGGINCFAVSAKGLLATIYLNGRTWSNWASLGGELKPSRAACVALARDRIVCFARGRRDQLMVRRWSGGKTWEAWRDLGGAVSADPACIHVGAAGVACFGRGAAGELVAFLPDAAGRSGGWTTLGGRIEGKPSCVRLRSGEVACAAQSMSGRLLVWRGMAAFAENAGVATALDEVVTAEPACALHGATLVCLTRDARRQLVRHSLGSGAGMSRDGVLDAPPLAAIACLSLGSDGLGCILTGVDRKLRFAANQELEVGVVSRPAAAVDRAVEGEWYLANLASGGMCRVMLLPELAFGAKRLRFGRRCRVVGLPARPAQWDHDESDLLFLAADGRILARFQSTQTGRWVTARRGAALLLTRALPEESGNLNESSLSGGGESASGTFGAWRVLTADDEQLCTLSLTGAPLEVGYALDVAPECGQGLAAARYWTADDAGLILFGPDDIVLARFDSAGPGHWRSQGLGGLTLER